MGAAWAASRITKVKSVGPSEPEDVPVTLKVPGFKPVPVTGTGPRGNIQITDIRAKLGEIRG